MRHKYHYPVGSVEYNREKSRLWSEKHRADIKIQLFQEALSISREEAEALYDKGWRIRRVKQP